MIWRSDTTKKCNYFNKTWLEFTGRSIEEELGDGWAEGVHPDDFDRCLNTYTTAFDKRELFQMEYRLQHHSGEFRWIFDRGVPFWDNERTFKGYVGSCIDIHEGKVAQQELDGMRDEEIKRLKDLIPMCAWCRKIKTDSDYWGDLTEYLKYISGRRIG